jgi:hypothetical protein
VLDAAVADLVAVTVKESDGEFGFLQPILVRRFAEGRNGQRQHEQKAAGAERRRFRQRLDQKPSPPAGDVKLVHDRGEPLIQFARPFAALKDRKIDPRVEVKQQPLELAPPIATRIGE